MSPYRKEASFKEEVVLLKENFFLEKEKEAKEEIASLSEKIKEAAGRGQTHFRYQVEPSELKSFFGSWAKVKPNTFAEKIYNKLIELGFSPEEIKIEHGYFLGAFSVKL